MRRIRIAWLILLLSAAICVGSHFAVGHTLQTVHTQLAAIRSSAEAGAYGQAHAQALSLARYYDGRQHFLELLLRRDTVAAAGVSLHGLPAYTQEETVRDLYSEVDKADEQIRAMEHLFFSVF